LRALSDPSDTDDPQATEIPIDGTLDLHTFHPRELRDLLPAYLEACAERGIFEVRVVHGKGTGTLRRAVEALLGRHPLVASFRAADEAAGGWGATLVTLRQRGL
jgi:DNA-nicking Smr family endonuclease